MKTATNATQPIDADTFLSKTNLIVPIIVDTVYEQNPEFRKGLRLSEVEWFVHHCELRLRWLYSTHADWKRTLEGKGNSGRDLCYTFITHWAEAYRQNPVQYRLRCADYTAQQCAEQERKVA